MIPDGYNEIVTVDGHDFMFRPLVHIQRESLGLLQMDLSEESTRAYCTEVIIQQLVFGSWKLQDVIESMEDEKFCELLKAIMGSHKKQLLDQENLKASVSLMKSHSHLLKVTCEQCKFWWYDPFDGTVAKRCGQPLKRPAGSVLPCDTMIGCPKGHWQNPTTPSQKNILAFKHYQLCLRGDNFPDDFIVTQNAGIIRDAMKECVS